MEINYDVETKYCDAQFKRGSSQELEYLKHMANNGWELISVVSNGPMTNLDSTTYYFKQNKK